MTIRFLQRWRSCDIGHESPWPSGAAQLLVRRGIAEVISDDAPKPTIAQRIVKAVLPDQQRDKPVKCGKKDASCRRKW